MGNGSGNLGSFRGPRVALPRLGTARKKGEHADRDRDQRVRSTWTPEGRPPVDPAVVDELAADDPATVGAAVPVPTSTEQYVQDWFGAVALRRVTTAKTCMGEAQDGALEGSGFPPAVLVALAAGGTDRMHAADGYETGHGPKSERVERSEIGAALETVVRAGSAGRLRRRWHLLQNGETLMGASRNSWKRCSARSIGGCRR